MIKYTYVGKKVRKVKTSENAITLATLVVTVIIMLILSGVTVSILTNGEGLFNKISNASDKYKQAAKNEAEYIAWLNDYMGVIDQSIEVDGFKLNVTRNDISITVRCEIAPNELDNYSGFQFMLKEVSGVRTIGVWTDMQTEPMYTFTDERDGVEEYKSYTASMKVITKDGDVQEVSTSVPNLPEPISPNPPVIEGTGLIPVKFDSNGRTIELTKEEAIDKVWYNYEIQTFSTENGGTSEWANAITKNDKGEITGYFVWIPRYEYRIRYNDNSDKLQGGIIDVKFVATGTTDATEGYTIHPAFTNEKSTGYTNGGWKEELPGFWISKYEAGFAGGKNQDSNNNVAIVDSTVKYTGSVITSNYYGTVKAGTTAMKLPVFLPKTYSYNRLNIGDAFNLSRVIQDSKTYYGLDNKNVDSHMIKNSEWGAVAYLTYSKYGRKGIEVTRNNLSANNVISTIYAITGYAGESIDAEKNYLTATPDGDNLPDKLGVNSYAWNSSEGVLASSTGNMYGVYDMSGGGWEYVAGYLNVKNNEAINNSGGTFSKTAVNETILTSTEYSSVYTASNSPDSLLSNYDLPINSGRRGEALWEISTSNSENTCWNGDLRYFHTSTYPFMARGGSYTMSVNGGIFSSYHNNGSANSIYAIRVILAPKM